MRRLALVLTALLAVAPAAARPALEVERVVLVMRHGVRPPTKATPLPAGSTADVWPTWDVAPGFLTSHGRAAIEALGGWYRRQFVVDGLLPNTGCPAPGAIALISDSDERTIATGDAWAAGLAPGCALTNHHLAQDTSDPLFRAAGENGEPFDPARADAAVAAALPPGGIAEAERKLRPALDRLDRILCGPATTGCGVGRAPTKLVPATADRRPKLAGALDLGSTGAQILLLEYADGKPANDVGWGRADARDIKALSALHAAEFAILARPPYLAARNAAPLARRVLAALDGTQEARITALIGHDTNVASLGGLLGLHWHTPGYAADDPPPGGALSFVLWRDRANRRFVEVRFVAQSLAEVRAGVAPRGAAPVDQSIVPPSIAGCARLCPLRRFRTIVEQRLR